LGKKTHFPCGEPGKIIIFRTTKSIQMIAKLWARNKHIILYGISLALLLVLLKWLELRFIIISHALRYTPAVSPLYSPLLVFGLRLN
jgi:hypothetical protein